MPCSRLPAPTCWSCHPGPGGPPARPWPFGPTGPPLSSVFGTLYFRGLSRPRMYGGRGGNLWIDRVLSWANDSTSALVVGSYQDRTGLFEIEAGPNGRAGGWSPRPLYSATSPRPPLPRGRPRRRWRRSRPWPPMAPLPLPRSPARRPDRVAALSWDTPPRSGDGGRRTPAWRSPSCCNGPPSIVGGRTRSHAGPGDTSRRARPRRDHRRCRGRASSSPSPTTTSDPWWGRSRRRGRSCPQWVAHVSGATPLAVLDPARDAGARRLGIHPPDLPRSGAASTVSGLPRRDLGRRRRRVVHGRADRRDLMGEPFRLQEDHRALYHAAAVFASNYLVTATAVAEQLLAAAGVDDPAAALRPSSAPRSTTSRPWARATPSPVPPCGDAARSNGPRSPRGLDPVGGRRLCRDGPPGTRSVGPNRAPAEDQRASVEEVLVRWT